MDSKLNLIGPRLRQLREHRELTVAALAERAGCSAEMIAALEAGELVPSLTPLFRLARGLGVRLGTLLDDHAQKKSVQLFIHSTGRSKAKLFSVMPIKRLT